MPGRLCLLHEKIDYDRKGCITYAIKSELRAAVEFDTKYIALHYYPTVHPQHYPAAY